MVREKKYKFDRKWMLDCALDFIDEHGLGDEFSKYEVKRFFKEFPLKY